MKQTPHDVTRRAFLAKGALLGSGLAAGMMMGGRAQAQVEQAILAGRRPDVDYGLNDPENQVRTVCLNCNTGCGITCKLQDGVVTKIDGNPFNPWTLLPHLPMKTRLDDAARVDGALCPKGQAGVQIAYDPYRIRQVLKRAGRRGENKWISIPFEQAIAEIVEGGALFAQVPGEEQRQVEGLRSIMALRDGAAAKEMAADVKAIWDEKDRERKAALVKEFQARHAARLDTLIDPDHPDMGPRNNQFVMAWGRLKGGRSDVMKRFGAGFGTTNLHGHTTVCQGSLYFTCKAISEQYFAGKFTNGKKFYWQGDIENSRYILFVGANLFEANYGPTNRTVRLTENLKSGRTRIAVADPRFSKLASKAEKWLPIKPGEDAALAMAIISWMLEHDRYDKAFLANANKAAAMAGGEKSWTNASWLVEIKDGKAGKFVRAADLGLASARKLVVPDPKDKEKVIEYEEKSFLVMVGGKAVAIEPNDTERAVTADLFVDTELKGRDGATVQVKSSLQILKESAFEQSFDEWCAVAGLEAADVAQVARELTSHGKQAVVDVHRGAAQHTNGFYNVLAWMSVNMLLGNFDWKGGACLASTYGYDGAKGGPYDLAKVPGKLTTFGVSSIRHDVAYDKTTLFAGYPARRNWYPLASDVYEEIIPSIGDAYPYPVKALFLYMGAPTYALPAGHTNIAVLADVEKLPLFFCSDILIGTTSMYADYIFPDLSFLERWEFQGSHPNMPNKVQPVRQPAIAPVPETVRVYGQEAPISFETLLMGLAEQLGLKGFGPGALGEGRDYLRPEDFYLKGVANIALGSEPGKEVPDADDRELEIFLKARRHLPPTVFDEGLWRKAAGEEHWRKVVYVLNRGGRYESHEKGYDGDHLAHPYGMLLNLYQEKTASQKYAGTGKPCSGIARHLPQLTYDGRTLDEMGRGHDLHLITHRFISHTKSRTVAAYWLHPLMEENGILMNSRDARRLGLANGDQVKVVSSTNANGQWDFNNGRSRTMSGRLQVTEAIRPGVVSFVLGFGHWATGAEDVVVNGEVVKGDARRRRGIHANAAMWTDPSLRHNTCLVDPVGGSVSFYDTKVSILKA
ncbi:MAG: molybdopterin-dependent oxidoreductase [bacterium]|nr:molybdopterin-dependent oxidoreductase [bacterium]